jgi:hypothetical protein
MRKNSASTISILFAAACACSLAFAEEGSVQPYIDSIKTNMPTQRRSVTPDGTAEPYINTLRNQIGPDNPTNDSTGYSEKARNDLLNRPKQPGDSTGYTEQQKAALPEKESGGAIAAVLEGHSELEMKRKGDIHHAFSMKTGVSVTRNLSAGNQLRNYSDVYGTGYVPELTLMYERQLGHSERYGSFGLLGSLGGSVATGYGRFSTTLKNYAAGTDFPATSQTKFQFGTLPVMAGINYRFNALNYVRPFGMVAPTAIGYFETRDDQISGSNGISPGIYTAAGVSILLDWMTSKGSWELYKVYGIKHYYLTAEYVHLSNIGGKVAFSISGVDLGLTVEY